MRLAISVKDGQCNVTISDFDDQGAYLGRAFGVDYIRTPEGFGARFSGARESRIEYALGSGLTPYEGTIEWNIRVDRGYRYANGLRIYDASSALIFTTVGADTWYPGVVWFSVERDGTLRYSTSDNYGGTAPLIDLVAPRTSFRFGRWHRLGIMYGREGRAIRLDGRVVARDGVRLPLTVGGSLEQANDLPTVGEFYSRFGWPNNVHERGFEGVVDWMKGVDCPGVW